MKLTRCEQGHFYDGDRKAQVHAAGAVYRQHAAARPMDGMDGYICSGLHVLPPGDRQAPAGSRGEKVRGDSTLLVGRRTCATL